MLVTAHCASLIIQFVTEKNSVVCLADACFRYTISSTLELTGKALSPNILQKAAPARATSSIQSSS